MAGTFHYNKLAPIAMRILTLIILSLLSNIVNAQENSLFTDSLLDQSFKKYFGSQTKPSINKKNKQIKDENNFIFMIADSAFERVDRYNDFTLTYLTEPNIISAAIEHNITSKSIYSYQILNSKDTVKIFIDSRTLTIKYKRRNGMVKNIITSIEKSCADRQFFWLPEFTYVFNRELKKWTELKL